MAGFFDFPSSRATTKKDQQLLKKTKSPIQSSPTAVKIKGSGSLLSRIQAIITTVKSKFSGKENNLILITDEQEFIKYIDKCIENGRVSIDTETTGLDPIIDTIVGFSLHTPNMKGAYIPLNHISYVTNQRIENQLSVEFVKEHLQRLIDSGVKTIWFNAPFDIRIFLNHVGIKFSPYADVYIAARIMNTEEPVNGLKPLHTKYCNGGIGESLTFDKLFDGIPFQYIPPEVGYLYAGYDGIYTSELWDFYAQYLEPDGIYYESKNMQKLSYVFFEIEMASMPSFIEMEQNGFAIDFEHAEKISKKYHELADNMNANLVRVCAPYMEQINDYRRTHPDCKLTDPINFNSPQQLSIIFYDVFGMPVIDKKNPRGVGGEILEKMNHPLAVAISDVRSFAKVISTYIDKLPQIAKLYPDNRIHCKLNQVKADTGRVSSDSPNMQNIPSRIFKLSDGTSVDAGHDIRQLFVASEGNILLSCDYSGQEVRVTAHMSHDEKMINAYVQDKDVYSEIAAISFNMPYDECKEYRPDGTANKDGKMRRNAAKKVVLGVLYGMGVPAIAEQLNITVKEAQEIYNKVLNSFSGLNQFIKDSEKFAREHGYTETVWGRRRHLSNILLPYYEFSYKDGHVPDFDPLCDEEQEVSTEVPLEKVKQFTDRLLSCRSRKDKEFVKQQIRNLGIDIVDNESKVAEAKRQCVNARVQGSAADLTKRAQIRIMKNEELRKLGFKLLIPVHDELIAECPVENVRRCAELMSHEMRHAGEELCVPLKCDVALSYSWYGEEIDIDTFN